MNFNFPKAPSTYAHILGTIILLIVFILFIWNWSEIKRLDTYQILTLLLLISITITLHGLSHLGMEKVYGYNPLN